jgi:hypothetical protein
MRAQKPIRQKRKDFSKDFSGTDPDLRSPAISFRQQYHSGSNIIPAAILFRQRIRLVLRGLRLILIHRHFHFGGSLLSQDIDPDPRQSPGPVPQLIGGSTTQIDQTLIAGMHLVIDA